MLDVKPSRATDAFRDSYFALLGHRLRSEGWAKKTVEKLTRLGETLLEKRLELTKEQIMQEDGPLREKLCDILKQPRCVDMFWLATVRA